MSARCRTALRHRWTCPWPELANKFFAVQRASERALAHRYRRIAEAMCAAASFCPSEHQEPFAFIRLVNRETLTCGAFGVPSIEQHPALPPGGAPQLRENQTRVTMLDTELRTMIDEVKDGRMDRRAFVQRMIGLGLTAPMATQILAIGGVAMAQSSVPYKPTKRGGGGTLKLLWWQGATLLHPHFA